MKVGEVYKHFEGLTIEITEVNNNSFAYRVLVATPLWPHHPEGYKGTAFGANLGISWKLDKHGQFKLILKELYEV